MTRAGSTSRRGTSARLRAMWRATYESSDYRQLPWYDADPSSVVVGAVKGGFLSPPGAVLDIGCGAGSNVLYLARQGFESHGVDLSPGAVQASRQRAKAAGLRVDVQEGDALRLPFPRRRFAGVLDHGCFHTLPPRRRGQYAAEVARVLRPAGSFLISWVARESTSARGPPHRPSVEEVAKIFEAQFIFQRTGFHRAEETGGLSTYDAWLIRRSVPQPPRR